MLMLTEQTISTVFRQIGLGQSYAPAVASFERGKTIFFPGDPAERVYFLTKGAVKLSRVYEAGEEITVALLRENSVFGVLSLITGQRADRFYHAVAFTPVELISVPMMSKFTSTRAIPPPEPENFAPSAASLREIRQFRSTLVSVIAVEPLIPPPLSG